MDQSPFKKGFPWLSAGVLLFLVSIVLYLYDSSRTDEDIREEITASLQADFDACLRYYELDSTKRLEVSPPPCIACELTYDELGRLISWSNNEYLPSQRRIGNLKLLQSSPVLTYDNRAYYQVRMRNGPLTYITLIPLQISHHIKNEFLLPFVFFGRWQHFLFSGARWDSPGMFSTDEIHALKFYTEFKKEGVNIKNNLNEHLFSITNISLNAFRSRTRAAVIAFFILGLIAFCIYLRVYTLHHWKYRYYINATLLLGVVFFRIALYLTGLPKIYVDTKLFSANILAFQEYIAPTLGDLTINIITLAIIIWILYVHFFRLLNVPYRKIITQKVWAWPVAILTIVLSSIIFKYYVDFFKLITINSQVDIAFSNIFKSSIYSYIILMDVGILLLSFTLVIISLLRFNILFGQRERYRSLFIIVHILSLLGINLFLHKSGNVPLAFIISTCLVLLFLVVYRQPFRPILHYDLVNYFLVILSFSILITYNVVSGIENNNREKVKRIAEWVLGSQLGNTVYTFETAMSNMDGDAKDISLKYRELKNSNAYNQFNEWLKETYFVSNFTQFEVWLYMYNSRKERLDRVRARPPSFGLEADISVQDRAKCVNENCNLYQLPSSGSETKYLDLYVGLFTKVLGDDTIQFVLELAPSRLETEGLYPSLSLEKSLYEEIKLINSFDHAVYRDSVLYSEGGNSAFPIYLNQTDQFPKDEPYEQIDKQGNSFNEYRHDIGNNRVVIVRYESQNFFQIVSTFSFIFYFFALTSLLTIVIPTIAMRGLRSHGTSYNLPLRAKIRSGLLAISLLPMVVIIAFLTPFISQRYEEEAKIELSQEAGRITEALKQDYLIMRNDALSRMSLLKEFDEKVIELSEVVRNDINVYNESGRRISSTQSMIYDNGLTTDLMNALAFSKLQDGDLSELVVDEKVGTLSYFSGYKPIIGANKTPIGYVNVPYIARQDRLDDQVLDFLAYLSNIYLLVFLLLNFVAVLVSNTITQPLSLIQQRLSTTSLEHTNNPIKYESKDEIGAIVTAYNQMVDKLGESERKLSQTHRELAWRQMARQVAHEIKNPLTPMRLSIQHLERAWKVKSNSLEKMFPRVMKTLTVQVDSLVRIANSFHEFAKMPDPVKDRILVNEVLLEVVDLYAQSEEATWLIDIPQEQFFTYSDRDQLSRCFNNIIKNGLQAIDENGTIHISMQTEGKYAYIQIKDNGKGMSEDVQHKVFEPNFSTKNSGMGLGLAIVKRIIESAGGNIDFESRINQGTTFMIKLPSVDIA